MGNLSRPYTLRLNSEAMSTLNELMSTITPEQIAQLTDLDRAQREGYRGYSGRSPKPKALLLRRAAEIGLPLLLSELERLPKADT